MNEQHDPAAGDPQPIGQTIEDTVEGIVTDASPTESTDRDGGSDQATRDGADAVPDRDDGTFTA